MKTLIGKPEEIAAAGRLLLKSMDEGLGQMVADPELTATGVRLALCDPKGGGPPIEVRLEFRRHCALPPVTFIEPGEEPPTTKTDIPEK